MESPRWQPAAPLVLSCPASRQPSGRATRCGVVQSLMQRIDVISGYETLFSWMVNTKIGSKLLSLWVILTHTHLSMDPNWLEKREWLINVDANHGEHLKDFLSLQIPPMQYQFTAERLCRWLAGTRSAGGGQVGWWTDCSSADQRRSGERSPEMGVPLDKKNTIGKWIFTLGRFPSSWILSNSCLFP
jgi:hypothetical protein